jgi:hypothetical protein
MWFLVLRAYWMLIYFDAYLASGHFARIYRKVRNCPIREIDHSPDAIQRVCAAVDIASIWYWKRVLCLQRASATACLLRRYGVAARMILGAQQMPFKAHAWVEVGGRVVNDKPYVNEMYAVLDQF